MNDKKFLKRVRNYETIVIVWNILYYRMSDFFLSIGSEIFHQTAEEQIFKTSTSNCIKFSLSKHRKHIFLPTYYHFLPVYISRSYLRWLPSFFCISSIGCCHNKSHTLSSRSHCTYPLFQLLIPKF